jgi:hypothetical protein
VEPHPANIRAATRAPAELNQRLLLFKITSLETGGQTADIWTAIAATWTNEWRLPQNLPVQTA